MNKTEAGCCLANCLGNVENNTVEVINSSSFRINQRFLKVEISKSPILKYDHAISWAPCIQLMRLANGDERR
jgi:hypothetical protein